MNFLFNFRDKGSLREIAFDGIGMHLVALRKSIFNRPRFLCRRSRASTRNCSYLGLLAHAYHGKLLKKIEFSTDYNA